MTYVENANLIKSVRHVEAAMQDLQGKLKQRTGSEATTQVADYFQSIHDFVKQTLDQLEADMDESTADTFNQYTPETHPLEDLDRNLPMPEDPKELIHWTLDRQNYLVEWCRSLAGKSVSAKTTEVFGPLADRLEEMNRQLAYDTKAYEQEDLHS